MDLILDALMMLKSVSPELGAAAELLMMIVFNTIATLFGQPSFCSSPAFCL